MRSAEVNRSLSKAPVRVASSVKEVCSRLRTIRARMVHDAGLVREVAHPDQFSLFGLTLSMEDVESVVAAVDAALKLLERGLDAES